MWPTTGSLQQVCFGCQRSHGKCEIGGKPVTARGPRKKRKIVSRATIEGDEGDVEWDPPSPAPKVAGTVNLPLTRALVAVVREMKAGWKSLEQIVQDALKFSREMLSQTTALIDLVELVVQGKRFVRMRKMGQPESDGEELPTRWLKKSKGKAKEDEWEEEMEAEEEAEERDELEGEPEDVDMTLN